MTILRINTLFFIIALFFSSRSMTAQSKYTKTYKPIADSLSGVYGIPSALILSVAIVESGSGTSRTARLLNNHFGIAGKNNLLKKRGIKTRYRQYPNPECSFIHFVIYLTKKKFYARLKGNMNCILWVDAISRARYSEKPGVWKQRVLSAIKKIS